jgi:hypothetical protein
MIISRPHRSDCTVIGALGDYLSINRYTGLESSNFTGLFSLRPILDRVRSFGMRPSPGVGSSAHKRAEARRSTCASFCFSLQWSPSEEPQRLHQTPLWSCSWKGMENCLDRDGLMCDPWSPQSSKRSMFGSSGRQALYRYARGSVSGPSSCCNNGTSRKRQSRTNLLTGGVCL